MNEAELEPASSPTGVAADRAIRWSIAVLLVTTALLKAYSPREAALLEAAYAVPAWLIFAVVQAEMILAVALAVRLVPRATRISAIALFTCFAAFSLYRALLGHESCGCFGAIQVNPWWTFALDLVVLAVLCIWRPQAAPQPGPWRAAVAVTAYGVLAVSMLALTSAASPSRGENALLETDGLTIVEPEQWIGKVFPLTPYLRTSVDIALGDWIVVLYHHDCPECQAAKPKYEALSQAQSRSADGRQVLLVEVPPFGIEVQSDSHSARFAKLSDEREWFVQAPVEIGIKDGEVTYASLKLPSIHPEASTE